MPAAHQTGEDRSDRNSPSIWHWLVTGAMLLCPSLLHAQVPAEPKPPSNYSIRWLAETSASGAVEVSGLDADTLKQLAHANWTPAQWQRLLAVYAEQGDWRAEIGLPPMTGNYRVEPQAIRFEPQFALTPGVRYRAVFQPAHLPGAESGARVVSSSFEMPARTGGPTTVVSQVYPSATVLPENLLKFYVHFSAPMSGGHIYEHIHLRDEAGRTVELPFLEIDEELWNPTMTRLTLFIDPGRIKRGVRPLEEIGPALQEGKTYALVIDQLWKDAKGFPLKESFQRKFKVGPPIRDPIDPMQWKVAVPGSGSRDPLSIQFHSPIDHALAQRLIRVTGKSKNLLNGEVALHDEERRWTFTPALPWPRGAHTLLVQTTLEDLAGNNIGKAFEVDVFENVQQRITNSLVNLPFEVK